MPVKTCFKCRRSKPIDQFYAHPRMADGHLNKCKSCTKKDSRAQWRDPTLRENRRAYECHRSATPKRKAQKREYQRKRRGLHRGKAAANNAVSNALRDGRLQRQRCEVCGKRAQAHHDDYRKKLQVRWLCFKHHREAHGQIVGKIK